MTDFDWTTNMERIRKEEQPKFANEIKDAISIGFHLKCLRCKKTYYHTRFAMSEMSYQMYSYCPDCIGMGLDELKKKESLCDICDRCQHFVYSTDVYCSHCGEKIRREKAK